MKKALLLLLAGAALSTGAKAQTVLNLNGTSYFQSFDGVANGLPTGWEIDSNATLTTKGTPVSFDASPSTWNSTTGRGKNYAAKGSFPNYASGTSALQAASTNRAMGLRQVGALDSQVAFTLNIAQTNGLSNLNMVFNLQSLDSTSPHLSTWEVQYGIGASPSSFTTVTATATNGLTTGGNTFSNSVVTASFGSALNNQAGPVVIRIVELHKTTGTGNRASTGIDSLTLSWTGTAVNNQPQVVSLSPANNATNVAASSNLVITFDKNITAGPGNIYIKNAATQAVTTKAATSSDVTIAGMTATIANLNLQQGVTYKVTFDSTAFKNGVYSSAGIYDSTMWVFTTQAAVVTVASVQENFDAACANGSLPTGWSKQNVQGPGQQWACYTPTGGTNAAMQINGFANSQNNINEDWLITPKVNLSGSSAAGVGFKMQKNFTGDEMQVLYSTNYDGTSAPSTATWTMVNIPMSVADTGNYKSYFGAIPAQQLFVAFKYISSATSGYRIRLDSVYVGGTTGIASLGSKGNTLPVSVLGAATNGRVQIGFDATVSGDMQAAIYDFTGRLVYQSKLAAVKGNNRITLVPGTLQSGLYIIRIGNATEQGIARTFIQ